MLAKVAERYNDALRELAAREGYELIDLERWADIALKPRDAYFSDAVHLEIASYQMLGAYLAERLSPKILNHIH